MKPGMHGRSTFSAAILAAMFLLPSCEKKAEGPAPCCEQPDIPAGVAKFKVVADDVSGPGDGLKVMLRAGLTQPAKRDQIYGPLKVLYAYAMKRTPLEPIHVEAWLYANESNAQSGGEATVIAKVIREQKDQAPRCENMVKYDFPEQVERAYIWSTRGEQELQEDFNDTCHIGEKKKVARYDEKFTHKTTYTLDPSRAAVEITYPYLEMGKDEYVSDLKLNSALGTWAEFMTSMFSKVDGLKELGFNGVYKDEPAVKIRVTREEFDNILARLQEQIASHAAFTFQVIGMGKKSSEAAEKEQEKFKSKSYKAALDRLPKEHVLISPKLKWVK
ncbi:MAG: hypothetical protein ABSF35_00710 [Polyangia bacterium]|jgi:hypothetical protein